MNGIISLRNEREKIDLIDRNLVKLLDKRLEVVRKIIKIKRSNGEQIFQPAREEIVLSKIRNISSNPNVTELIFRKIMTESKKFQEELI